MSKNKISILNITVVAAICVLSAIIDSGRYFALAIIAAAFATLLPFFVHFERKSSAELIAISAVMTALSVAGRFLFAPIPFFKPVTAIVIIAGISLGSQCGFMCGALSALISNIYFGQGPWTPFQMLSWGLIGFFAGILSKPLSSSKPLLLVYGSFSGIIFSLIMDTWSTLWIDGTFKFSRFITLVISALPVTLCYILSNIIFLIIIAKPMTTALSRIVKKYGLKF